MNQIYDASIYAVLPCTVAHSSPHWVIFVPPSRQLILGAGAVWKWNMCRMSLRCTGWSAAFCFEWKQKHCFWFQRWKQGVGDLKDRILLRRCDDFAGSSGSQLWPRSHSNQSKLRFIFFKTRTRPGRINMDHGERSQWDNRLLFNTCRAAFIHRSNCCGGAGQIMAPKDLKRSSKLCF